MSKKADENWGMAWNQEQEMECGIALQHLAGAGRTSPMSSIRTDGGGAND